MLDQHARARSEPAVTQAEQRLAHPLELGIDSFDRERPGGILVELGNVAAPPSLELVGEDGR